MSELTKKALAMSLKKLMKGQPLDKITVTAIAEDCGINRQTFYYHFQDIYDLVDWIYISDASAALAGAKTYDTWQEGFYRILQYILDNRTFVMRTYHSISREHLERYLYQVTYGLLIDVVEEKAQGMSVRREDKEYIAHFYKYSLVGVVLDWIGNGLKQDPQKIVGQVGTVVQGAFLSALERFQTKG